MSATMADYDGFLTTLGFIRAAGPVNPSGPLAEDVSQRGIAGLASRRYGYAGKPFQVRTLAGFASYGDVRNVQVLYTNYRTRNVDFTDDLGNIWSNLIVIDVKVLQVSPVMTGVGLLASSNYLVEAEWTLQSAAVAY